MGSTRGPSTSGGTALPRRWGRRQPGDRVLVGATLALGAPLLRSALLAPRGQATFRHRAAALAATWAAGGVAGGQLAPGLWAVRSHQDLRGRVLVPAATAAGTVAVFGAGAAVVSRVPFLRAEIETVLAHATRGPFVPATALALVTGAGEELFFRGTLHDVMERAGLPTTSTTTAVYAVTTCATGNPLLVLASALLGVLTGRERNRTDSLLAPTLVHLGWSLGMIVVLPRITARSQARSTARDRARPVRRGPSDVEETL